MSLFSNPYKKFRQAVTDGDVSTACNLINAVTGPERRKFHDTRDSSGYTALHNAISRGDWTMVDRLLLYGADPLIMFNDGYGSIDIALRKGNVDIAGRLLSNSSCLLDTAEKMNRAMDAALAGESSEAVNWLIEKGYSAKDQGSHLLTALEMKKSDIAMTLLRAGAPVDASDNFYAAIHHAVKRNHLEAAAFILERGVDVNLRTGDSEKNTPLHRAAYYDHPEMVQLLLARGARTDLTNYYGHTPLKTALEYRRVSAAQALQDHEAAQQKSAQSAVPAGDKDCEEWLRMGHSRVAHIGTYPAAQRRLTDIFNFETRERTSIVENLTTGAESVQAAVPFDEIDANALVRAVDEFRKLGGTVDDSRLLRKNGPGLTPIPITAKQQPRA